MCRRVCRSVTKIYSTKTIQPERTQIRCDIHSLIYSGINSYAKALSNFRKFYFQRPVLRTSRSIGICVYCYRHVNGRHYTNVLVSCQECELCHYHVLSWTCERYEISNTFICIQNLPLSQSIHNFVWLLVAVCYESASIFAASLSIHCIQGFPQVFVDSDCNFLKRKSQKLTTGPVESREEAWMDDQISVTQGC